MPDTRAVTDGCFGGDVGAGVDVMIGLGHGFLLGFWFL
jgi:hypothetical protein